MTADEKYGPGRGSRPISSMTTTMSTSPSPRPPCSSGTSRPGQPSAVTWSQNSSVNPRGSSAMARTYDAGRLGGEKGPHTVAQRVLIVGKGEVQTMASFARWVGRNFS